MTAAAAITPRGTARSRPSTTSATSSLYAVKFVLLSASYQTCASRYFSLGPSSAPAHARTRFSAASPSQARSRSARGRSWKLVTLIGGLLAVLDLACWVRRRLSRPQDDLEALVLLLLEDPVEVRGILEAAVVRREVLESEHVVARPDDVEQLVDPPAHVALAHADGETLVEELHHRHGVDRAAVDAADRERAAAAHGRHRRVQGGEPVEAEAFDGTPGHGLRETAGRADDLLRHGVP